MRCWIEGAGAGILVVLPLLWLHLSPSRATLYHQLLPMTPVYRGVLIDFAVAVAISMAVFALLEVVDRRCLTLWWLAVVTLLVTRATRTVAVAALGSRPAPGGRWLVPVLLATGLILWAARRSGYSLLMRGARLVLFLLGCSIFWVLPELVLLAAYPQPHETASFSHPVAQKPHRRIVWILFDELSYDQIFDHRQPGMDYPGFDRFAAESVKFADVAPAGFFTELVIPSLLEGETVTGDRSDLQGRLWVRTQEDPHWRLYPADRSLFAEAKQSGWSTGVVGWYNPYCRVFAQELTDCYWNLTSPMPGGYSPRESAWTNAWAPIRKPVAKLLGRRIEDPQSWQNHAADFEALMEHARSEIAAGRIGFLFVHLPVPHPGGFYNRRTRTVGVDGSYLDNMALTDETLRELNRDIETSELGDRTTVIVSSDHSWRISLWRHSSDWRAEDTRVAARGFDPRPVLLVHFPSESAAEVVARPFPLLAMHAMIEKMMAGEIENAQQLETWAGKQDSQ